MAAKECFLINRRKWLGGRGKLLNYVKRNRAQGWKCYEGERKWTKETTKKNKRTIGNYMEEMRLIYLFSWRGSGRL